MAHTLKRIRSWLHRQLGELGLVTRGLYALTREGYIAWLIYFVRHRSKYGLKALHSGVQMNHDGQGNLYNFRRNIHRIEKGLLHLQPKAAFAESYISETVTYLAQIRSAGVPDSNTIAWGEAVLDQYFSQCLHTEPIAKAYVQYQELAPENTQPTWHPYPVKERPKLSVEYEALYQLALRRRSVRYFLDKTVEFDVVEKAMKVAALSPSACNRQSFKFLFYNDRHAVNDLSQVPGGFAGYEVPSMVVVTGSYRGYFDERDVNVPIIDASLAVMAFLFALETLGLSSVCINLPALPDRDESLRRLVHLDDDEFVVMLIGIGYPDPKGKIPFSAKRNLNCLISCNEKLVQNRQSQTMSSENPAAHNG